jgi:hypothetical protein
VRGISHTNRYTVASHGRASRGHASRRHAQPCVRQGRTAKAAPPRPVQPVSVTGMHLIGVDLTGMYLIGVDGVCIL